MIKQIIFGVCLLFPDSVANPAWEEPEDDRCRCSEWELDRNSGGVKTYTRWITMSGSGKVRERMGEMVLNSSIDAVVKVLCDSKSTEDWMSGIKENYCLKQVNRSEWYGYTLFDIPWPFEKRDLISNYKVNNADEGNKTTILISSKEDFLPEKSNIKRLKDYKASWTIVKLAEIKVIVFFKAMANTPPMFPRFIQDPILAQMFHNNLVNLKKILETR